MKVLVTGGAGFIGSALIRHLLSMDGYEVVNVDKLTYAADLQSLSGICGRPAYRFEKVDIADRHAIERVFREHRPDAVVHLAAESHVDRSIAASDDFLQTNVVGTYTLLEVSLAYWRALSGGAKDCFRFHHISTDEVFGDLGPGEGQAREGAPYNPGSPYAATKAASDHLVRAWNRTYGLPTLLTNCSNNYGPYQFPEKLIPLMIRTALKGRLLPVYGQGQQVRDWLHVEDHAEALELVLRKGRTGETYNIGGGVQARNIDVVRRICAILDELVPTRPAGVVSHGDLISFVADRPGHDMRYAIDFGKLKAELGWQPRHGFEDGLRSTVAWYVNNRDWCERVTARLGDDNRPGQQRAQSPLRLLRGVL